MLDADAPRRRSRPTSCAPASSAPSASGPPTPPGTAPTCARAPTPTTPCAGSTACSTRRLPQLVERTAQVAAETGLTQATTVVAWAEQLHHARRRPRARSTCSSRSSSSAPPPTSSPRPPPRSGVRSTGIDDGLLAAASAAQAGQGHGPPRSARRRPARARCSRCRRSGEIWQAHCPSGGWPRLPDGLEHIEEELAARAGRPRRARRGARDDPRRRRAVEPAVRGADRAAARGCAPTPTPSTTCPSAPVCCTACAPRASARCVDDLAHAPHRPRARAGRARPGLVEHRLRADPRRGPRARRVRRRRARCAVRAVRRRSTARTSPSLSGPVLGAVVGHVVARRCAQHREQAEALFAELVEERLTSLRDTVVRYPDVARRLRPVLAASPMLVPQVLPADAHRRPRRHRRRRAPARRGRARRDRARSAGRRRRRRPLRLRAAPSASSPTCCPSVALRADASRRDPYLTAFLAAHGYAGVLRADAAAAAPRRWSASTSSTAPGMPDRDDRVRRLDARGGRARRRARRSRTR